MLNEKLLRLLLFIAVAGIHVLLLVFLNFTVKTVIQSTPENARIMRVTDFNEAPPPPPPPPPKAEESDLHQVEAIAEVMIETEIVPPDQIIVAPGTIITPVVIAEPSFDDYFSQGKAAKLPVFNEDDIVASLVYPPIALRSNIEGRVILELFIDKNGFIKHITILQETPQDRGFGDAAVRAFTGKRAIPAMSEDNEPIYVRYRYPVTFRIK
jgi:protein TonB